MLLGIDDFGIYNVVGGIVVLFTFLNTAMSSATQRFLTFELGKKIGCGKIVKSVFYKFKYTCFNFIFYCNIE